VNLRAIIAGSGVVAPGLPGFAASRRVLSGRAAYAPAPIPKYRTARLPANERRRLTETARLAFQACEECVAQWAEPAELVSVFGSYSSDVGNLDKICRVLARDPLHVSPTVFHNSVNNAPAGYWTIGLGSSEASTTIAAGTGTFAATLLEGLGWVNAGRAVLMACYDMASPRLIAAARPVMQSFAAALLLAPDGPGRPLTVDEADAPPSVCADAALENLRRDNPSAQALPLLQALARDDSSEVILMAGRHRRLALHIAAAS